MSKLVKGSKQDERTWAQLNRRLIFLPFDYDSLYTLQVAEFVNKKAASIGSCPRYLVPCLLMTTVHIIAENVLIHSGSQDMPCNLFMVFVGPPETGKSQVLKEGARQPICDVQTERDLSNTIIEKCTSSALVKTVAQHKKAFVVSPKVSEVLSKLLNSDEDNATGDVQILNCFLGKAARTSTPPREPVKFHPMSHLQSLIVRKFHTPQVCSAGWTKDMVSGTGSCSCFLCAYVHVLLTPMQCVRGSKLKMSKSSKSQTFSWKCAMHTISQHHPTTHFLRMPYTNLTSLKDDFIKEVNDAIKNGNVPPKSKNIDTADGNVPRKPSSKEIVMEMSYCINVLHIAKAKKAIDHFTYMVI